MLSTWIYGGGLSESAHSISVAGLTALTLTQDQALHRAQEFTGALTGDCTVTFPLDSKDAGLIWYCTNSTSGTHLLIISGPSGATYTVPQGRRTGILWNGTNMVPAEASSVRSDVSIVSGITGASPTVTLTAAQAQQGIISLQGNATGTPVIIVPSAVAQYIINTQLASASNVQVQTASGTAATLNATGNALVYIDNNANGGNCQIVASTSA